MSIEAMKRALEALEETESALARCMGPHKAEEGDRHRALAKSRTAITALRLAIGQAEKQESYWQEEARRYAGNADFWREKAKRQPLTEEELEELMMNYGYDADDEGMKEMLKEAIERAHGIEGEHD